MSTVEDRKKNRIKKTIETLLLANPITGVLANVTKLLKGKLTPEKEITLDSILSDLKLGTGDRGAAEAMPKKDFDKSVAFRKRIKDIQENKWNVKPAPMPKIQDDPRDNYPQFQKKGGKIKTKSKYSKGGGVRPAKYKIWQALSKGRK